MPPPLSVRQALRRAASVDARAEGARRAALRLATAASERTVQPTDTRTARNSAVGARSAENCVEDDGGRRQAASGSPGHTHDIAASSAGRSRRETGDTERGKALEERRSQRRQQQHASSVRGVEERMDTLGRVMHSLLRTTGSNPTVTDAATVTDASLLSGDTLSPGPSQPPAASTGPRPASTSTNGQHADTAGLGSGLGLGLEAVEVGRLRSERAQLHLQLQDAARLMEDVRTQLAAGHSVRRAHDACRERTAVLRVLLGELRRVFEESGIVAPAPTCAPTTRHTSANGNTNPSFTRAPVAFVRASGLATQPRSATAAASLAVSGDPGARQRQGLERTAYALFRDAERCLGALEMDLDASDAGGVEHAREDDEQRSLGGAASPEARAAADVARHLLEENRRSRESVLAAGVTRERHVALQAQMRRLQDQIQQLAAARETDAEARAEISRENNTLHRTVHELRGRLAELKEQRSEELSQAALDVSQASSASNEWRSAAEAGLAEAEALRRHARASAGALSAARDELRSLRSALVQAKRDRDRLQQHVRQLEATTDSLSRDLDDASVRLALSEPRRSSGHTTHASSPGQPSHAHAHAHSHSHSDTQGQSHPHAYSREQSHAHPHTQSHPYAHSHTNTHANTHSHSHPHGNVLDGDAELYEALHGESSGGTSELSQLDRDIQALKASLRAMLAPGGESVDTATSHRSHE